MRPWGHGIYDNDEASCIVRHLLNTVGINPGHEGDCLIPMANNTILIGEWTPEVGKLHQVVIKQLHSNFKDIEKDYITKEYELDCDKDQRAQKYLILIDILYKHGYIVPVKSAEKAYKCISQLLKPNNKHTLEYEKPTARKNNIKKVLLKLSEQIQDNSIENKIPNKARNKIK